MRNTTLIVIRERAIIVKKLFNNKLDIAHHIPCLKNRLFDYCFDGIYAKLTKYFYNYKVFFYKYNPNESVLLDDFKLLIVELEQTTIFNLETRMGVISHLS